MSPTLERHDSPNDPLRGNGLERFDYDTYNPQSVIDWAHNNKLPAIITTESLAEAPDGVLVILRNVAREHLLDGMSLGKYDRVMRYNEELNGVLENRIKPSRLKVLGEDVYTERYDDERTRNFVLPIETDKGTIEIVVSNAWGVSWRIGKDHDMALIYPQLTIAQLPDTSVVQKEIETTWNKRYISPDVLATISEKREDFNNLIHKMADFLTKLSEVDDLKIQLSGVTMGNNVLGESEYAGLCFESKSERTYFYLEMGKERGIKMVSVYGYKESPKSEFTELAKAANELNSRLSKLQELS